MKKLLALLLAIISVVTLMSACGKSGGNNSEVIIDDSGNKEIVLDEPLQIIDNGDVNIKITGFFCEYYNKGTDAEFSYEGFSVEAENKNTKYDIRFFPEDCSLSDRKVIEFGIYDSDNTVSPGKIATIKYIRNDDKHFDSLEQFYEMEGVFELRFVDDTGWYSDLDQKIPFSISEAMNGGATNTNISNFTVGENHHFGETMDAVIASENGLEISDDIFEYSTVTQKGGRSSTFEGFNESYVFYLFDKNDETMKEAWVLIGAHLDDYEDDANVQFSTLQQKYNKLYGDGSNEQKYSTAMYRYITSGNEFVGLKEITDFMEWEVQDASGTIIIELIKYMREDNYEYVALGIKAL